MAAPKRVTAIAGGEIRDDVDDRDVDVELTSPTAFFGSHVNMIPLQSSVQAPRLFYGARFYNQAMPLAAPAAPLVRNLDDTDPRGRPFDEVMGPKVGALFADDDAEVERVGDTSLTLRLKDGTKKDVDLYRNFPFNRKTSISQFPKVKKGDRVTRGQLLARSNYTDDEGAVALGTNLRVGLVAFKGHSMDDAVAISESAAKKLTSDHSYTMSQDFDHDIVGGKGHYRSLFPDKYTKDQLEKLDDKGVVVPGTVVQKGDPLILATRPRSFSSTTSQLGKLSKAMRQSRYDAAVTWEDEHPGTVTDVAKTKKGWKVIVGAKAPTEMGDKIVLRSGQKGIVSKIIPDSQMPRTVDGEPLEVLLNQLGIPSRVNNSLIYELALGKVAAKRGKAITVPGFNKVGEKWFDIVEKYLGDEGLKSEEEIFDPMTNRKLGQPITVGVGHVLKLHHTAASKANARGQGSYDCYDAETEVLTSRGWVAWPDVYDGDFLYTPDLEMGKATYEQPSRLVSYDFDGELLGYRSRKLDFLVTPNHKMAYATPKVDGWREGDAESLFGRKVFLPRAGCALGGRTPPNEKVFPAVKASRKKTSYDGPLSIPFADYVELVAWWASEGSVDEGGRLTIWQSKAANPENYDRIKALLARVGGRDPFEWDGERGLRLGDPRIGFYLKAFGEECHTKTLPEDLRMLAGEWASLFVGTYVAGDGHVSELRKAGRAKTNRIEGLASSSPALMEALQQIIIHQGLAFHYAVIKKAGNPCHGLISKATGEPYISQVDTYGGNVHRQLTRSMTVPLSMKDARYTGEWYRQAYKGQVYCATTSTGYLMVRRNGKVMISGNSNEQPAKGGGELAQAKRLSGLEVHSMLSSGAYRNLMEGSTLRGQKNDEYWRALRSGYRPKPPGEPFVWDKFQALLNGAGLHARKIKGDKMRLGPFTDDELERRAPLEITKGDLVDVHTLEPVKGGLFDQSLVGNNKWGRVKLPFKVPNPAFEDPIRHLLGLTRKELRAIMAGEMELPEHLR